MEGYIGEIRLFAGNFAPRSWAFCQGQILSIAQNNALFAILGTTYGGNGQTTFGLPDLRGRVPVGPGQGPGLSAINLGQQAGVETVTLTSSQLPAHTHTVQVNASSNRGNSTNPNNARPASANNSYTTDGSNVLMASNMVTAGASGGSQPHDNRSPYLGLNYIVCLEGIFPSVTN